MAHAELAGRTMSGYGRTSVGDGILSVGSSMLDWLHRLPGSTWKALRRRSFHAMVACCCLIAALVSGAHAVFLRAFRPLTLDHYTDWGYIGYIGLQIAAAIIALTLALTLPVAGFIADRYGAGRTVVIGIFIYAAGLVLTGMANAPAPFTAALILGAVGYAGCFSNSLATYLGKKVGSYALARVSAYMIAAAACGHLLFSDFGLTLIESYGPAGSLIIVAILVVLSAPFAMALRTQSDILGTLSTAPPPLRQTLTGAFANRDYLLLLCGFLLGSMQTILLDSHGWSYVAANQDLLSAYATPTITAGFITIGALVSGFLANRLPLPLVLAFPYFAAAATIGAFLLFPLDGVTVAFFGFATAFISGMPIPPTLLCIARQFGTRWLATLAGFSFALGGLSNFVAIYAGDWLHSVFDENHAMPLWLACAFGLLASVFLLRITDLRNHKTAPGFAAKTQGVDAQHVIVDVGDDVLLGAAITRPQISRAGTSASRRAAAISIMAGLVLFATTIAAYWAFKTIPRPESIAFDILVLTLQSSLVVPFAIAYWLYCRLTRTPKTLLWLRKFRESDRDKYQLQYLIKHATKKCLSPMTIQDASYRASYLRGMLNPLVAPMLIMFLTVATAATAAYIITWQAPPTFNEIWNNPFAPPRRASYTDFLAGIVVWFFVVPALGYFLIRRLGYRSFADRRGLEKATRRLQAIKSGTTTVAPGSIDVWKCSNENWQSVVHLAVSASDIVLVDLSEVNENIWWEINTVRAHKKAANIVWVAEQGSLVDRRLIEDICGEYGCGSHDIETLARKGGIFVYPATPLRYALPRRHLAQAEGLRSLLLARLLQLGR